MDEHVSRRCVLCTRCRAVLGRVGAQSQDILAGIIRPRGRAITRRSLRLPALPLSSDRAQARRSYLTFVSASVSWTSGSESRGQASFVLYVGLASQPHAPVRPRDGSPKMRLHCERAPHISASARAPACPRPPARVCSSKPRSPSVLEAYASPHPHNYVRHAEYVFAHRVARTPAYHHHLSSAASRPARPLFLGSSTSSHTHTHTHKPQIDR